MKKTLLLLAILFSITLRTYAQDSSDPKFGVGLTTGVTIGPASGAYPEAGAVTLKFEQPMGEGPLSLVLTTGFTYFVSKDGFAAGYNTSYGSYSYGSLACFVPVQIGAKAYVFSKFFLQGDIGASFNINSNYQDYTQKKIALLVTPSIGYTIPMGDGNNTIDVGLGYENRVEPGGGYSQINLRGTFNFSL